MPYFVVAVLGCVVNEKGEVLLAKRNDPMNPHLHHRWQMPGGSIDKGEIPEQAVIREVKEETGLIVALSSKRPAVSIGIPDKEGLEKGIRFMLLGYLCKITGGVLGQDIDSESAELKWFKLQEIPWDQVLPGNKKIIEELLKP